MRRGWELWLSFFLALILVVGSAAAAYKELVPYVVGGGQLQDRLTFLAAAPPDPGLSLQAQRLVLNDCATTLPSFLGVAMTDEVKQARDNCETLAQSLVHQAPIFSFAWYSLAVAQSLEGPSDAFQNSLSQSQLTTANQWEMASLRLVLAYRFWDSISADLQKQLGADIVVLAHTGDGRRWLALRYAENIDFREDVTANLENAPPNIQRAFVAAVSSLGAK